MHDSGVDRDAVSELGHRDFAFEKKFTNPLVGAEDQEYGVIETIGSRDRSGGSITARGAQAGGS